MTTVLDHINGLIDNFRDVNGFTSVLTTLVTLVGALVVTLFSIRVLFAAHQGFRLYVLSQFFCNRNNTRRYGHWAVVTGAANGIGRAMARELARRGHSIVALDIDAQHLIETKTILEREPNVGQVVALTVDLSDSSLENYGRLEKQLDLDNREIGVLINCAGLVTNKMMKYARFELDAIRKTVNVNILATALVTRLVLPKMSERRRGLILNISSILADVSQTYLGVYGSSKAFVSEFSRSLNLEYSDQIDVVYLTPCAVRTNMLTGFGKNALPSAVMVSPDYFARSALNAIGTGVSSYSGCWWHGLNKLSIDTVKYLGLTTVFNRLYMGVKPRRSAFKKSDRLESSK